jgi:hypothetical protein
MSGTEALIRAKGPGDIRYIGQDLGDLVRVNAGEAT